MQSLADVLAPALVGRDDPPPVYAILLARIEVQACQSACPWFESTSGSLDEGLGFDRGLSVGPCELRTGSLLRSTKEDYDSAPMNGSNAWHCWHDRQRSIQAGLEASVLGRSAWTTTGGSSRCRSEPSTRGTSKKRRRRGGRRRRSTRSSRGL